MIRALENSNGAGDIGDIINQVRRSDAMRQAAAEAQDFASRARARLSVFPQSEYRQALEDLADFVVSRHV